jgi:hypothetical protein
MDFERVVKALVEAFARGRIRYGVIGGLALGALGAPRATADIDVLVHRDDLEALHHALSGLGYTRSIATENVSHYRHVDQLWGGVDVLHAFRKFSLAMLDRARALPIFGGTASLTVLQPEDVIGLKVQAMANDPERRAQELADIEALMARYGDKLDWERIEEFYRLFDLEQEASALRKRFGHAES